MAFDKFKFLFHLSAELPVWALERETEEMIHAESLKINSKEDIVTGAVRVRQRSVELESRAPRDEAQDKTTQAPSRGLC